jgi:hypothetical protein
MRLLHIGGMGERGSIYQRAGNFIAAGLGTGTPPAPQSSAGQTFSQTNIADGWEITIREVDLTYMLAPPGFEDACADAALWNWYWSHYRHSFPSVVASEEYPICDKKAQWRCGPHGNAGAAAHAQWFQLPPAP